MKLFSKIADAFDRGPEEESSLAELQQLSSQLMGPRGESRRLAHMSISAELASQPAGTVFVHGRRPQEPLPVLPSVALSGVPVLDTKFRRREEQLRQERSRDYSAFSIEGLAWLERGAQDEAALAAQRQAEDAEIARRRFEEDAALAARRAEEDAEQASREKHATAQWVLEREQTEAALQLKWRTRVAELSALLDEELAAHRAQLALEQQRLREEELRAHESAARLASQKLQQAGRETEALVSALRDAELSKLRLSGKPSLLALRLVGAGSVALALRFACTAGGVEGSTSAGGPRALLREDDRSWWRLLHCLEADGLAPPLKASEEASALFGALDDDGDGAVLAAEAGYVLALLCSGGARARVDAACDSLGAPAAERAVSLHKALEQLKLCARVRDQCAAPLAALLGGEGQGGSGAAPRAAALPDLQRKLQALFSGQAALPAEGFRSWLATEGAALFAPLA